MCDARLFGEVALECDCVKIFGGMHLLFLHTVSAQIIHSFALLDAYTVFAQMANTGCIHGSCTNTYSTVG